MDEQAQGELELTAGFIPQKAWEGVLQDFPGGPLRVPQVDAKRLEEITTFLRERKGWLKNQKLADIISLIGEVIHQWSQPDFPLRRQVLQRLPAFTGYPAFVVEQGLEQFLHHLSEEGLWGVLQEELGDPLILEEWCPRKFPKALTRAYSPNLIFHLIAGNIPGLSLEAMVYSLMIKSPALLRISRYEPLLGPAFARTLYQVSPELGSCIAVLWWPAHRQDLLQKALQECDGAVLSGGREALHSALSLVPPHVKVVCHPYRLSVALIGKEAVSPPLAKRLSEDVLLFDQRGCLSPGIVWIEEGGELSSRDFASLVANFLNQKGRGLGSVRSVGESAQIWSLRSLYRMAGALVIAPSESTHWTIVVDEKPEMPEGIPPGFLFIKPVSHLGEALEQLRPKGSFLQAVGLEVAQERKVELVEKLGELGASRICSVGEMQKPPVGWRQDGRFHLLDLLRFCDWEE